MGFGWERGASGGRGSRRGPECNGRGTGLGRERKSGSLGPGVFRIVWTVEAKRKTAVGGLGMRGGPPRGVQEEGVCPPLEGGSFGGALACVAIREGSPEIEARTGPGLALGVWMEELRSGNSSFGRRRRDLRCEVCVGRQVENPGLECAGVERGHKGT